MYDYYDTGSLAVFGILIVFGLIFAAAGYVLSSLFLMKIFEKAGVEGKWRAWVPVYNAMILAKLGDVSPWVMLGAIVINVIPVLNYISWIAYVAVLVIVGWRVGLKLQKDAVWVLFGLIPGIGVLIWLGINAFDKSRWNPNVAPAPWANNGFLGDNTVWQGIPVQPKPVAGPGYGAPQGYAPPAQPGYAPPAQPGYAPPAQPGYAPPAGPAAPATGAPVPPVPPTTPPAPPAAPPTTPPAPPAAPPAPPAGPPAPPTDPTQPPA
ncbi:large exoprotein [Microbacterium sp. MYb66]|uniref:large exoprotein n=1 Tax=Microbacterium sp. MYb66 TaxID=1848692 RepID=UPI000CFE87D1|nr:large exoprotein [Microbacterium sp. MYb66]PRA83112.1 large exoprotein [Microbacterium sp. MYb66]